MKPERYLHRFIARSPRVLMLLTLAAALAAITLCAFAPVLAFRAQDAALLGIPQSFAQPTGQLAFAPQDIPLVRNLYAYEAGPANGVYVEDRVLANQSHTATATLLPRTQGYIKNLVGAGVLSEDIGRYLEETIFPRPQLNYTHLVDNYGRETLRCNFGMGTTPPCFLGLTVDMATDLAIGMEVYFPSGAPSPVASTPLASLAAQYVTYLGLDATGDWRQVYRPDFDMSYGADISFEYAILYSSALRVSVEFTCYSDSTQTTLFCFIQSYSCVSDDVLRQMFDGLETE